MKPHYSKVYRIPHPATGQTVNVTSVVMDEEVFTKVIDDLGANLGLSDGDKDKIKTAKHVPFMAKGTKTQFAFDQFDIKTEFACMIVRGHGKNLMKKIMDDFEGNTDKIEAIAEDLMKQTTETINDMRRHELN